MGGRRPQRPGAEAGIPLAAMTAAVGLVAAAQAAIALGLAVAGRPAGDTWWAQPLSAGVIIAAGVGAATVTRRRSDLGSPTVRRLLRLAVGLLTAALVAAGGAALVGWLR